MEYNVSNGRCYLGRNTNKNNNMNEDLNEYENKSFWDYNETKGKGYTIIRQRLGIYDHVTGKIVAAIEIPPNTPQEKQAHEG
jgi:hypothetical protein